MITTVLPVVSLIIGALLQYFFTRHHENQRYLRELRTQAYLDFLKGVADLAHLNDPHGSQERDAYAKVADSKTRICLYGSREVVMALAVFEKLGALIKSVPQREAFMAMVLAMRRDSGSTSGPKVEDIEPVLLGIRDRPLVSR
jgi:hypothetical protein